MTSTPLVSLAPTSLSFTAEIGGPSPSPQTINVSNGAGGILSWTAIASAPWIRIAPLSGTAPSIITVTVNTTNLGEVVLKGNVVVTSTASSSSASVLVTVTAGSGTDDCPPLRECEICPTSMSTATTTASSATTTTAMQSPCTKPCATSSCGRAKHSTGCSQNKHKHKSKRSKKK